MGLRRASQYAAAAGLLLLLANAGGGSFLLQLGDEAARQALPPELAGPVRWLLALLLFVAGLGGLAVLAGALLYRQGLRKVANLLVDLGAGTGFLGLLLLLGLALSAGEGLRFLGWLLGPAGLGVVLAVLARREAGQRLVPRWLAKAVRRLRRR